MSVFWQPTNPGWGNAATVAKKKPKKTTASVSQNTYDPYEAANAGVQSIIDAMLASWEHDKQQAYDTAQREAEAEYAKAQALAEGLQKLGISQAVQQAFQNAGTAQAGLAQGFSGAIRNQAAAQAAEQQRMLSGTGQEGAVRNQGENMGNVTYGAGGFIPGTALNTTGAAFAADAALQPGFALQFGELAAAARRKQWADEELPGFTEQRLEILAKRPELLLDLLKQTQTEAPSQTKLTSRALANGQVQWYDPYTGKPVGKPTGPVRTKSAGDAPNLQAKRLANGQYVAWDPATGKTVGKAWGPVKSKSGTSKAPGTYNLQMKDRGTYEQAWDPRTGRYVGPRYPKKDAATTKKYTTSELQDLRQRAGEIARQSFKGYYALVDDADTPLSTKDLMAILKRNDINRLPTDPDELAALGLGFFDRSYQEAMTMLLNADVPLDVAQKALNRFWTKPGDPRPHWKGKQGSGRPSKSYQDRNQGTQKTASLKIPITRKGTHVTDGLGWGTQTANDTMGDPGTTVGAPEDGYVVRHGSAQGGEALYFQGNSGRLYWIGHIDQLAPVGTRIRKGKTLAVISADHPRPHVHVDWKWTRANA